MKILVCEDDPVMMLVLTSVLRRFEYEVISSKDGKEALDLIYNESPDIVITDMLLPNLSGADILSYVKNLPGKKIPVIILSSMPKNAMINNGNDVEADCYLLKPVLPLQLKSKIEELKHAMQQRVKCII